MVCSRHASLVHWVHAPHFVELGRNPVPPVPCPEDVMALWLFGKVRGLLGSRSTEFL